MTADRHQSDVMDVLTYCAFMVVSAAAAIQENGYLLAWVATAALLRIAAGQR